MLAVCFQGIVPAIQGNKTNSLFERDKFLNNGIGIFFVCFGIFFFEILKIFSYFKPP